MKKEEVQMIVKETVKELKKNGMLKDWQKAAYSRTAEVLTKYYESGETDETVRTALEKVRGDMYFEVIPMYYGQKYTVEHIAEVFGTEVSTIGRNKKRLCLELSELLEG